MSEEKTYKYVILRNRNGEYLIPYSGVHGLADVAFTGKYSDLIDTPDEGTSFLPATKDVAVNNRYNVGSQVVMIGDEMLLDYDINYLVKEGTDFEDLVSDVNAVHSQYVNDVANYLVDSLQKQINRAIEEAEREHEHVEPYPDITKIFRGYVQNFSDLYSDAILSHVAQGDVYFVTDPAYNTWYMYLEGTGNNWVQVTLD